MLSNFLNTVLSFSVQLVCDFDKLSRGNILKPYQPKVFGVKFSLREIERIFYIDIRNFKLWKMP